MKMYNKYLQESPDLYYPNDVRLYHAKADKITRKPSYDTPVVGNNGLYMILASKYTCYTSKTFIGLKEFIKACTKANPGKALNAPVRLVERNSEDEILFYNITGITDSYQNEKNNISINSGKGGGRKKSSSTFQLAIGPDGDTGDNDSPLTEAESYGNDFDDTQYKQLELQPYKLKFYLMVSTTGKCMTVLELHNSIINLSKKLCFMEKYSVDPKLKYTINNASLGQNMCDFFAQIKNEEERNKIINRYKMILHTPVRLMKEDGAVSGGQLYYCCDPTGVGNGCLFFGKNLGNGADAGYGYYRKGLSKLASTINTATANAKPVADQKQNDVTVPATPAVAAAANGDNVGIPPPPDDDPNAN